MPEWGFFCGRRPPHPTSRPWTITVAPGAASCGAAARASPRRRAGDHRNFAFQIPANSGHSSTSVLICLIIDRQREL